MTNTVRYQYGKSFMRNTFVANVFFLFIYYKMILLTHC